MYVFFQYPIWGALSLRQTQVMVSLKLGQIRRYMSMEKCTEHSSGGDTMDCNLLLEWGETTKRNQPKANVNPAKNEMGYVCINIYIYI